MRNTYTDRIFKCWIERWKELERKIIMQIKRKKSDSEKERKYIDKER